MRKKAEEKMVRWVGLEGCEGTGGRNWEGRKLGETGTQKLGVEIK